MMMANLKPPHVTKIDNLDVGVFPEKEGLQCVIVCVGKVQDVFCISNK